MAPPNPVVSAAPREIPTTPPAQEGPELLAPEKVVTDSRWEDASFRVQHMSLYLALGALQDYFTGKITSEKFQNKFKEWTGDSLFSDPQEKDFNQAVVDQLHAQLALFQSAEYAPKAQEVKGLLPPATPVPVAISQPVVTPAASSKDTYVKPTGFRFGAITIDVHGADESLRSAPHYYTLGVLPVEGLGQNQSSDFGFSGGAQFAYNDFNFLAGFYQEDMTPLASPAHYHRAGIRLGLAEYNAPLVGELGPEGKFHFSLFGRQRLAMELGSAWCNSIDNSDISGAKCPGSSVQVGVVSQTDTLNLGYGPFEAGVTLLPGKVYLQSEQLGLPEINRLPIEFQANWHFAEPAYAFKPRTSQEVLRDNVSDAEVTMTAATLGTNEVLNNFRRKQEAAYEETRILSFGNKSQFTLTNAGTFLNGILTGWSEGSLAHRLARDFHYGNTEQRVALASVLGVELAANLIGLATTPGTPDQVQTFPGQTVPPAANLSGNAGITDMQARAFRMNVPQILVRDGLTALGALGTFGDRNQAIKGESAFHPIMHGALAAGGAVLILTSGNGSGTGFLGYSIMGNQPPEGNVIQLRDSSYSLGAQAGQYFRLEAGTQLFAYGASGLIDYALSRFKYLDLKDCETRQKADPQVVCGGKKSAPEQNLSIVSDLHLGIKVGSNSGQILLQGRM